MDNMNGARGGNQCMNSCGLAEGAGAHTLLLLAANGTTTTDFVIDGTLYTKDDADNIAMTALAEQAIVTSVLYLVTLTTGGTLAIQKGNEELTADVTSGKQYLEWPQPSNSVCAIGGFRIDTNTIVFTCGTTDLAAITSDSGTVTYFDFNRVPAAPVVA